MDIHDYQFLLMGFGVLYGVALLISAVGFYRVVYFISIGYAYSIVAMVLMCWIVWPRPWTWGSLLQMTCLVIWGLRLGFYLLHRESQGAYQRERQQIQHREAVIVGWQKLLIWGSVSGLYVSMFSPCWFAWVGPSWAAPSLMTVLASVGGVIMISGVGLEIWADQQKATFKARYPRRFCDHGVYGWVRCPNYFGEMLVWLGNWVMGVAYYHSWAQWGMSLLGLVCITLIMLGSAKRLEREQAERYGDLVEHQDYVRQVPILIPFVPVYTLKGLRVFLE